MAAIWPPASWRKGQQNYVAESTSNTQRRKYQYTHQGENSQSFEGTRKPSTILLVEMPAKCLELGQSFAEEFGTVKALCLAEEDCSV